MNHYLIFQPDIKSDVASEWIQCLEKLNSSNTSEYRLMKVCIFAWLENNSEYKKLLEEIRDSLVESYGDICPAFSLIPQPPERPWKICIEAGYSRINSGTINSSYYNSLPYVVRETKSEKEIWACGLASGKFPGNTRKAAILAFEQMKAILDIEKMSCDNIVRQWNFIGDILEIKSSIQNYQIFNEIRSDMYHKYRIIHSYPAATGIGMHHGGVTIDFCAVKPANGLKIIAIDNPDQIRPYDYGQKVLIGKPACGKGSNQPPQFERALFITDNHRSTLFVSGTASIIGQETMGIDDVEEQTNVTLENISKLTDVSRIRHLTGNPDADSGKPILFRIYIKRQIDFPKVKSICTRRFPGVPMIFCEADVCRNNLLVEIEAEFLFEGN